MNCSSCGHDNPERAKFCLECGAAFALRCANCSTELPTGAKFCLECGTRTGATSAAAPRAATPPASASDTRKVVTIVFADLVGSTALHERLDAESARRFMESYYVAMRAAVDAHGGTVTQLLGDGVKAVFGIPRVAEDDAIRAVHAAVAMQNAFRELAEQQRGAVGATGLRVAVNTGEVVANDADEIIGDPVNVAARLQERGGDGDVVVGETTRQLVGTLVTLELLGSFALKGRSEEVKAYRVVSLEAPAGAAAAPFVGRTQELARLGAVYDTAVSKPAAGLAVLVGSPGLGKSRLIDEFVERSQRAATVVRTHCDAAGGATFAPLATGLREFLEIEAGASAEALRAVLEDALPAADPDRARIVEGSAALLAGSPAPPEETFFIIRRLLGAFAKAKPVVLVIDDLQWAEPLLLDLIEHLVQWGSGTPLMLLVGARPELRELRSSLVTPGGLVADVLTLTGLDAGAAMRLAANVIGASDLPAAIAAKVLAASEGNPLFVGELVRMLVQEGALTKQGDRWTVGANLASLEMPPTIHALLASRIERLRPEDRSILERAAVVGRQFSRSAVEALLPGEVADLDARLESLRRAELIERDSGWFLGEPMMRFHHLLIRDAAYRRLLKGTRAELHARLANWVEAQVGGAPEHDETVGRHLEQAHALLRELGPLDAEGKQLGARAATRLSAVGRRALARDDVSLAAGVLGRALASLDPADPARAELALDWCEALLSAGDVGPAAGAIDELARFCDGSPRLRAWHTCFAGQLSVLTAPEALRETTALVAAAAGELATLGDAAGEAKAHFVHAQALARLGNFGACEAALDHALAAARRAEDRRRVNAVLAGAPLAALWGPSPVTRASGRCLDVVRVLRITQGAPAVEAMALSCQGVLEALRGRTEAARRMLESSRKMVEDLGITHRLLETEVFAGRIDLLEGDAASAERALRSGYEGLRELGLGIDAARAGALLARALLAQDRAAEAEALSHESEALAGDDLQAAIAWRGVRAEALARRGEHAQAVEFAHAAVGIAVATDALLDHADARLALAAALRAAGRSAEADAEEQCAIELWEAKGATLLAERERGEAASVGPAPDAPVHSRSRGTQRRVRANAASAVIDRISAAFASRSSAEDSLVSEDLEVLDHRWRARYGRAEWLETRDRMREQFGAEIHQECLATLGTGLCISRYRFSSDGSKRGRFDVGELNEEYFQLSELAADGVLAGVEFFAADHLDDALVRLYELHAAELSASEQPVRAFAARALGVMLLAPDDPERHAEVLAPGFESVDHRPLSGWTLSGADVFLEHLRALGQVAADVDIRSEDVLALEPNAVLVRRMHAGTERVGGGGYERPFLALFMTDSDGRTSRAEWFDAEHGAQALARFDELAGTSLAAPPVRRRVPDTAAVRHIERYGAALAARDLAAMSATLSEELEVIYHPTATTYGRDALVQTWRELFKTHRVRFEHTLLTALGESFALSRQSVSHEGADADDMASVGPIELDRFLLIEIDGHGRCRYAEVFGEEHFRDAFVRLCELHAASLPEGSERDRALRSARSLAAWIGPVDLERWSATLTPDFELIDRRTLGLGTLKGREAFMRWVDTMFDLSEDLSYRLDDVLAVHADAMTMRWINTGTQRDGGGAFDRPFLWIGVFASDGRFARFEQFDADREAEALARFDAITATSEPLDATAFANAATRWMQQIGVHWHARDWSAFTSLVSPDCRFSDRRRLVQLELDRERWVELTRQLGDMASARLTWEFVATRGERLALARLRVEVAEADVGPSELEHLNLLEMDERGEMLAGFVRFDCDDLEAAYAELDARWEAGEAALHPSASSWASAFWRAFEVRDWDAVAALHASDQVAVNHRLVGWGTLRGAGAWAPTLREFVALSPDVQMRIDHLRTCERGFLYRYTWHGTRDGGAFETPCALVVELDGAGLQRRLDIWDIEQLPEALARFEELRAVEPPSAARFENSASRMSDRLRSCWITRDWERFAKLLAADFHASDRRRSVQLEMDRDEFVAFCRNLGEMESTRMSRHLLATRGERLELRRSLVEVAGGDIGQSEISSLSLLELDERGAPVAILRWDDDAASESLARVELEARWRAEEESRESANWVQGFTEAFSRRDWAAVADRYADDVVAHDHRLVSWGTLRGVEDFLRSLRAMIELAADANMRADHIRMSDRGLLMESTWVGTRDGGPFESVFIVVTDLDAQGKGQRLDFYDSHHLDRALARFEELSPDPLRIPPNAATRARDQVRDGFSARDWDAMRALVSSDFVYEDRGRRALVTGDIETWLASMDFMAQPGVQAESTLLATLGDRIALHYMIWVGTPGADAFELDRLRLFETAADGSLRASIMFDVEDRTAAFAEAQSRFLLGEAAGCPSQRPIRELGAAWEARDWTRVREILAEGPVVHDHRLLGLGRLDRDKWIESWQVGTEMAPDARGELIRILAWNENGRVWSLRVAGTRDGGEFENLFIIVAIADVDRVRHFEFFEVGDAERAIARFEELSSGGVD